MLEHECKKCKMNKVVVDGTQLKCTNCGAVGKVPTEFRMVDVSFNCM